MEKSRRIKSILVILVILAVAAWVVISYIPVYEANELVAAGDYEAAVAKYLEAEDNMFFGKKAKAALEQCRYEIAQQAIDAGDFEKAIEQYEMLDERQLVKKTYIRFGDKLFEEGDYEAAAKAYKGRDSEKEKQANLKLAEAYVAREDYANALTVYDKYNMNEEIISTRILYAESLYAGKDYDGAAEQYRLAEKHDDAIAVLTEKAEIAKQAESWDEAINVLNQMKETFAEMLSDEKMAELNEATLAAHAQYAASLHAKFDYDGAAQQYRLAEKYDEAVAVLREKAELRIETEYWDDALNTLDQIIETYKLALNNEKACETAIEKADLLISLGRRDEVPVALMGISGNKIADYFYAMAKSDAENLTTDEAVKAYSVYGSYMTDVDTQLYYCNLLIADGTDIGQVYPDGVTVSVDLAPYQILDAQNNQSGNYPNYSSILVFSRSEAEPSLKGTVSYVNAAEGLLETLLDAKKLPEYGYSVKLEPAIMINGLNNELIASSLADATTIIIIEKGYFPFGYITERETTTSSFISGLPSTTYKTFVEYAAYEAICAYDKADPMICDILDAYQTDPLMINAISGDSYADANINLTPEQIQEITLALADKDSVESKTILAKYDEPVVEFVGKTGWGNYLLLRYYDENGNIKELKASSSNTGTWNTSKFMVGSFDEGWLTDELINNSMAYANIYGYLYGTDSGDYGYIYGDDYADDYYDYDDYYYEDYEVEEETTEETAEDETQPTENNEAA